MGNSSAREATLSIRLAWPFVRIAGADPEDLALLAAEGVGLAEFGDPDTRVRHSVVMQLLRRAEERIKDPALGLRAGELLESSDLGVLEHVVRTCGTLREGMRCGARYGQLMNGASRITIEEGSQVVVWRWEVLDGVPQLRAANDFVVTCFVRCWRRYTGIDEAPVEIHFMHSEPTNADEYARIFRCPFKFGMPHNAILLRREFVDAPMRLASRGLHLAFDRHAQALYSRLLRDDSVSGRVRDAILGELQSGDPGMEAIARKLAMSVATLRRRLEDEGTSHRQLLDEVRCSLAKRYLLEDGLAISEVAFLLGFAHVTAFYKAFKRWMDGVTPAEFRQKASRQGLTAFATQASKHPALASLGELELDADNGREPSSASG